MSSSKRQSLFLIGIAMIIIAGVLIFFALSQPKLSLNELSTTAQNKTSYSSSNNNSVGESSSADFPVNINTATIDELVKVDGIGQAKASAIIEYREKLGAYTSVEQIKQISGIGEGVYEKVAPYLCV